MDKVKRGQEELQKVILAELERVKKTVIDAVDKEISEDLSFQESKSSLRRSVRGLLQSRDDLTYWRGVEIVFILQRSHMGVAR